MLIIKQDFRFKLTIFTLGVAALGAIDSVRAQYPKISKDYSKEKIDEMIHEVSLGIITNISQVGGFPNYRGEPYLDGDRHGMPDNWEARHGLDPKDPSDATTD